MANIMINQVCNLRCKYCFADNQVNNEMSSDMTFDTFKFALRKCIEAGQTRFGIIGGEPTLHPQFEEFVRYASSTCNAHWRIAIFSNGLLWDELWQIFLLGNVNSLWNFNGPEISGSKFKKIQDNMELMLGTRQMRHSFTLGINMYEPTMNVDYFVDACKEYKMPSARIGITVPNLSSNKEVNSKTYLRSYVEPLLSLCERLCEVGTVPHMDCNYIPLCCWAPEDLERIEQIHIKLGVDSSTTRLATGEGCHPTLDIMPDLTVVRCFGCTSLGTLNLRDPEQRESLFDCTSIPEISDRFSCQIDAMRSLIPSTPDCETCLNRLTSHCTGSCMAYKLDKMINGFVQLTGQNGGVYPYER